MSYEAHPHLNTPPDNTVLWRYSDFAKFLHLLETRTLWFARVDQFEDPLEATYTDAELKHLRALQPGVAESHSRGVEFIRATGFVNCWRAGSDESLAMWDLYGKGSGIVAACAKMTKAECAAKCAAAKDEKQTSETSTDKAADSK